MAARARNRRSDPVRRGLLLLLATMGLPLVAQAAPQGSAKALFLDMQHALKSRSYQGSVVYMRNGQPEAYRLIACSDGYARLTALTGPPREVVRGPHVAVRLRGGKPYMAIREPRKGGAPLPFPPATQAPISGLKQWYRFELGGLSRIAGERARLLELVPRDHWRYGYRVWISRASSLPLRSQLVGSRGGVLEQAFFTRITILRESQARKLIGTPALRLAAHAASVALPASARASCPGKRASGVVSLGQLPPGFQVLHRQCQVTPGGGVPVTHVTLGDGINDVSVFVAPHRSGGATLTGQTAMGPVHAMGRIAGGYAVTVMGTVPMVTIARIARGVRIKSQ